MFGIYSPNVNLYGILIIMTMSTNKAGISGNSINCIDIKQIRYHTWTLSEALSLKSITDRKRSIVPHINHNSVSSSFLYMTYIRFIAIIFNLINQGHWSNPCFFKTYSFKVMISFMWPIVTWRRSSQRFMCNHIQEILGLIWWAEKVKPRESVCAVCSCDRKSKIKQIGAST